MKYIFLIISLYTCFSWGQSSFPTLVKQKLYGGGLNDIPTKVILTTDDAIVIGGYSYSTHEDNCTNVHLLKIAKTGEVIWDRLIDLEGCQELRGLTALDSGAMMFVGVTNSKINHEESSDPAFYADGWVGKIAADGNIDWLKPYGGKEVDFANAVERSNNEYFVVGGSFSHDRDVLLNRGGCDLWGFRIDDKGETKFLKTIGGTGNEWAQAITTCKNGDYVMVGFSNSPQIDYDTPSNRNGNGLIVRFTPDGKTVWTRSFKTPFGGIFNDVQEDADGRLIVAGSYNLNHDDAQFWFLKLTFEGKTIVDKKFGSKNDEYFTALTVCQDTTYLCGGYSSALRLTQSNLGSQANKTNAENDPYIKGKDDFMVMKFSKKGELIWRKTYGGPDYERCADVLEYAKGKYLLVGEKENYFTDTKDGNKDFWLLQVEEHVCDEKTIRPSIFVRADNENQVVVNHPIRFRARHNFGEHFLWNFGDGTTSTEEQPLKTFKEKGSFPITLTISINETCKQTISLPKSLNVVDKE